MLKDKSAFVCGSTQGIGRSAAMELASCGARVTLLARNENRLRKVADEISKGTDTKVDTICVDFSAPEDLEKKVHAYVLEKGPIHILVNNTGGPPPGLAHEAKVEDFKRAFSMHLICNQILVKALLHGMKSMGYGRIINVISTSVKAPIPGLGVSNTIRAAVANWAKTLANELGPYGVTVNNILPGSIQTGRLDSIIEQRAQNRGQDIETVKKEIIAQIPAGRLGQPDEVAKAIAFLASEDASYINGINLPVDGGRTASL